MRSPGTATVLGVGAAVATGIAAGVYGYEQITKRMPRYKQQRELLAQVGFIGFSHPAGSGPLPWRLSCVLPGLPPARPRCSTCRPVPAALCRSRLLTAAAAAPRRRPPPPQYERMMLPPRTELQGLENDIVKQVRRGWRARARHFAARLARPGLQRIPLQAALAALAPRPLTPSRPPLRWRLAWPRPARARC